MDIEGDCPNCAASVDYDEWEPAEDSGAHELRCPNCGWTGMVEDVFPDGE